MQITILDDAGSTAKVVLAGKLDISGAEKIALPLAERPAEGDAPLLWAVDAVQHVEHGALARPVGADDGADLVLADVEAHVGEGLHAAEGKRDALHREDHLAHLAGAGAGLELAQVHAASAASAA